MRFASKTRERRRLIWRMRNSEAGWQRYELRLEAVSRAECKTKCDPLFVVELRYGIPLDWTHTSPKHNKREPSHLWTALVISSTMCRCGVLGTRPKTWRLPRSL